MAGTPAPSDFDGWVQRLARSGQRREAKHHLLSSGSPALPALRRGLRHPNAKVRQACAGILDNLVDEETLPDLIAALDDPDPEVRGRALHALACEPCKQNGCYPHEDVWVSRALEFLGHTDADIRASAIDALGKVARRRPDIADALVSTAHNDRHPAIRNMARLRVRRLLVSGRGNPVGYAGRRS